VISVKAQISMEHRFSIGNLVLVLDPIIEILLPIGSSSFLVLDPMVGILVPIGSSPFSIRINVFLILVLTTKC